MKYYLLSILIFIAACTTNYTGQVVNQENIVKQDSNNLITSNTVEEIKMVVVLETNMGNIKIELDKDKAPISVENFLSYVNEGYYDGLIFHRVIDGFMIQGGGFDKDMNQKETKAPIKNEAQNGLKNDKYTLAMARTGVVDSATSQFFINVVNNDFLNFKSPDTRGFGYAVFGKVASGQDVVDKIKKVETTTIKGFQNVPKESVVIEKAYVE